MLERQNTDLSKWHENVDTGNNGYIGSVLTSELLKIGYEVMGYDMNYFYDCALLCEDLKYRHIQKDLGALRY